MGPAGEDEGLGDGMEGLGVENPPLGTTVETMAVGEDENRPAVPVTKGVFGSSGESINSHHTKKKERILLPALAAMVPVGEDILLVPGAPLGSFELLSPEPPEPSEL